MPLGSGPGVKGTQNTGKEGSPQARESTPGPSALSGACRRHGGGDGGLACPGRLSVLVKAGQRWRVSHMHLPPQRLSLGTQG